MTLAERNYHTKRIAELKVMIERTRCSDLKDGKLKHRRHYVRQYKTAIAKHQRALDKAKA